MAQELTDTCPRCGRPMGKTPQGSRRRQCPECGTQAAAEWNRMIAAMAAARKRGLPVQAATR